MRLYKLFVTIVNSPCRFLCAATCSPASAPGFPGDTFAPSAMTERRVPAAERFVVDFRVAPLVLDLHLKSIQMAFDFSFDRSDHMDFEYVIECAPYPIVAHLEIDPLTIKLVRVPRGSGAASSSHIGMSDNGLAGSDGAMNINLVGSSSGFDEGVITDTMEGGSSSLKDGVSGANDNGLAGSEGMMNMNVVTQNMMDSGSGSGFDEVERHLNRIDMLINQAAAELVSTAAASRSAASTAAAAVIPGDPHSQKASSDFDSLDFGQSMGRGGPGHGDLGAHNSVADTNSGLAGGSSNVADFSVAAGSGLAGGSSNPTTFSLVAGNLGEFPGRIRHINIFGNLTFTGCYEGTRPEHEVIDLSDSVGD